MPKGKPSDSFILVNFKTYLEATGKKAVDLSQKVEAVGRETGVKVGVAPQFCDIAKIATQFSIPVFAQHIDPIASGAFTGHILAESVKAAGATGSIINHSERTLRLLEIEKSVDHAREVGLETVVCAGSAKLGAAVALSEPDMVAIEPPELIGSGRAVSKERPEILSDSVKRIRAINSGVKILCGAGISTGEDVHAALKLSVEGVLVASGIVKAPKPQEILMDFCNAIRKYQ
jgi:triosephosphate isomerase